MTLTTRPETVDVLIVGAGHAGLAMSGLLSQAAREHLVLERRDRLGGGWQDRWDEFRLVTPNWTSSVPGWAYDGADPDGFMSREEITARVARYADVTGAPVGTAGRVPRRYRGRDIFSWIVDLMRYGAEYGVSIPTVDHLPDPQRKFSAMPNLSGHGGGHDTNLRQYAADGMTLAGRLSSAGGGHLTAAISGCLRNVKLRSLNALAFADARWPR